MTTPNPLNLPPLPVVAYRFPKAGIDNGHHYTDTLKGEEPRFKSGWEPLCKVSDAQGCAAQAVKEALEAQCPPATNVLTPDDLLMDKTFAELHLIFSRALKGRAFYSELSEVIDDIKFLFSREQEKTSTLSVPAGYAIVPIEPTAQQMPKCIIADVECRSKCGPLICKNGKDGVYLEPASAITPAPEQDALDAARKGKAFFKEGFYAASTYNDVLTNDVDTEWANRYPNQEKLIDAAIAAGEGGQP